jgi:endonuclease-8
MPEGDTIHKVAAAMRPFLLDKVCIDGWTRDGRLRLEDRRVLSVDPLGKQLLIGFEDGFTLRSHLGMSGSWHRYAPGEAWTRPRWQVGAFVQTADDVLVCFQPKEVEWVRTRDVKGHPVVGRLGPDLLDSPDLDVVVHRSRAVPQATAVADLILDQRVACGAGNVYKSEVCFIERVHPYTPIAELSDPRLRAIWAKARDLLEANLGPWFRTTTVDRRVAKKPARPYFVYSRGGEPCLVCGSRIRSAPQGPYARITWWCPTCQLAPSADPGDAP